MDLQQRTHAWYAARRGKLTASNIGALLGLQSWTTPKKAYQRIGGRGGSVPDQINSFCQRALDWGVDNETNAILEYSAKTGNVVEPTGFATHRTYPWIGGSPDGLIGKVGLIEVKCPFFRNKNGKLHTTVPSYYWLQMIFCLECTGREWCDYICWVPKEGMNVFRVYADKEAFNFILGYLVPIHAAVLADSADIPNMSKESKANLNEYIEKRIAAGVDKTFWVASIQSNPPIRDPSSDTEEEDEDEVQHCKRMCLPEGGGGGESRDGGDDGNSETVRDTDTDGKWRESAAALQAVRHTEVPM
jgi:putative phage-type endonuclease